MTLITTTNFGVHTSEECSTGIDMLKACGGDFTLEKRQVAFPKVDTNAAPDGMDSAGNPVYPTVWVPMDSYAVLRSDTQETIADKRTVGDGYEILQNHDMIKICDAICESRDMNYDFMTTLEGGKGLAIQVSCPDLTSKLQVGNGESGENQMRLTMLDMHDGTGSLRLHFSMLRMFCKNTLPALHREFRKGKKKGKVGFFAIRHTKTMAERVAQAVTMIREHVGDVVETAELMRQLAGVACTKTQKVDFFRKLANPEGLDEREMTGRAKAHYEARMHKLEQAAEMDVNKVDGADGSWYEVLQAATHYGTHGQIVRGAEGKSEDEKRFISSNFNSGANFNVTAAELALETAGV